MDELIGDVNRLTCTCGSTEEHMHVVLDIEVEEVVEANSVIGGNQEVVVADFLGDLEGRSRLRPVLPHKLLAVVEHIEHMHFFRDFDAKDDRGKLVIRVQFEGS